jgi:putative DNA methylase
MTTVYKKLIEVALPLPEINDASAYDKMPGIGAHPKGIHHWWARLPLPVARAVLFASVVDDPSSHPEQFPTEEAQERERERLFGIVRKLMQKQLQRHPEVYAEARAEMLKHCDGKLPPVLDPFAGGGSIPLEAARLGMEAYAGDLNPVAVLLNKCYLKIVPRWADHPPVNPEDRGKIGGKHGWRGSAELAADVRYYGRVILERAREGIGHLYPPVRVTEDMAAEHPHLKPYVGKELPVIAWLWARKVPSPNPAARGAPVPLMSTFWLSSKKGSEAWLEPVVDRAAGTWRFRVRTGGPADLDAVKAGTKTGRAMFRCLLTGDPIPDDYIKEQGKAGRMDAHLVAIVADTGRGRVYLPATEEHEAIARRVQPAWKPEEPMNENDINLVSGRGYGFKYWYQLFTPRQLTAMVTLSDLVREVREEVRRDALAAGLSDAEADAYAATVTTFLALALDRCADFNNSLCRWKPSGQQSLQLFARQAIPMVWDFVEPNIMGDKAVCWATAVEICADALEAIAPTPGNRAHARPIDAASPWNGLANVLVSTDPPYYDNIGYAALSDFFYVWLRRTIGDLYPELFATILVPKEPELVAAPERFDGDRRRAKEHFEAGFRRAFAVLREKMDPRFPLTVYYAFKQDDEESGADEEEGGSGNGNRVDRTTGWETMLTALVETGFQVTATWPVRSAQKWRQNAMGANALASYIVLACRPRAKDAPQTDRRSFVAELKRELPTALRRLQQGNIAPVDFAQAAIGPGMAIYSRYSRILEASGRPMSVRTALALINQTLTEVLSEQEDEFDADTRWAIAWYEQHGFEEGEFGDAELLSKAKVTTVAGLVEGEIVVSRGGKVRLLRPEELPDDWDPSRDRRLSVWEATHHLVKVHWCRQKGDQATADLLRRLGSHADLARDLAYRLFSIAEKKGRSADAQGYNALVLGWSELAKLAQEQASHEQPELFQMEN